MRLLEPTAQIWTKIDPYYLRQKCRPIIIVSGNIRFMGIFVGVPLDGGVKWEQRWRRRQFLAIWVATSSESSEIMPAILYGDICYPLSAGNWLQNEWPWAAIWRQNRFSANTLLQRRCVFWSPLHKFQWRYTHTISDKNGVRSLTVESYRKIKTGVPLFGPLCRPAIIAL